MQFIRITRLTVALLTLTTGSTALAPASPSNSALAIPQVSCSELLLKLKSALTRVPIPKRSPVQVNSPLVDLLNSKPVTDPEMIRLFTRHPDTIISNPHYLENMADSIRESFAPWFENKSDLTYPKMLKQHHAILTQGLTRRTPYLSSSNFTRMKKHRSGRFRYEMASLFNRPILEFSLNAFFDGPRDCPPALLEFLNKHDKGLYYRTSVESIPIEYRPNAILWVFRQNGNLVDFHFQLTYPESAKSEIYVKALEVKMLHLKNLPKGVSQDALTSPLADYIQLFSVGLPFDRVNFSIAMSHVNYILMSHGFRGMENGELDLASAMLSTQEFRKAFTDEFKRAQSQ